jgi:hypothetical protein
VFNLHWVVRVNAYGTDAQRKVLQVWHLEVIGALVETELIMSKSTLEGGLVW